MREILKNRIAVLVKTYEKQNTLGEAHTLEESYKKEAQLKEKIKSIYPKPTPYDNLKEKR